ncbi:MAG TPA: hypothetical protein VF219_15355, partial [Vicinamibacterales bacterium]
HSVKAKLAAHGADPALIAQLFASMRAGSGTSKVIDVSGLPLVPFHCSDFAGLMVNQPLSPGRDMTNAGKAISMSIPAFDATRTHALVLSVNDVNWLLGHSVDETELSLLSKKDGRWAMTWHSPIRGWAQRNVHETPVTHDDHAVFDAMLARLAATKITGDRCIRVANESRVHDALEISTTGKWTKRGGDIAEAFQEMLTRGSEYIGEYKPRVRAELVVDDVLHGEHDQRFGSCGAVVTLTLPGFSRNRETAVAPYYIGFLTTKGVEWGDGTMLLRRNGGMWSVAEDDYHWGVIEPKDGPKPVPH